MNILSLVVERVARHIYSISLGIYCYLFKIDIDCLQYEALLLLEETASACRSSLPKEDLDKVQNITTLQELRELVLELKAKHFSPILHRRNNLTALARSLYSSKPSCVSNAILDYIEEVYLTVDTKVENYLLEELIYHKQHYRYHNG